PADRLQSYRMTPVFLVFNPCFSTPVVRALLRARASALWPRARPDVIPFFAGVSTSLAKDVACVAGVDNGAEAAMTVGVGTEGGLADRIGLLVRGRLHRVVAGIGIAGAGVHGELDVLAPVGRAPRFHRGIRWQHEGLVALRWRRVAGSRRRWRCQHDAPASAG